MEFTEIRDEDDLEEVDSRPKKGCLWRLIKSFLVILIVVLAVLGVLPTILSTKASRQWALAKVNGAIAPRQLSIDQWSLGWFSAPVLTKIEYVDTEKGITFKADGVTCEKGLLRMIPLGKWDLGKVTVKRPDVAITPPEGAEGTSTRPASAPKEAGAKQGFILPISDIACTLVVQEGKVAVSAGSGPGFIADQIASEITLDSILKPVRIKSNMRVGMGTVSVEGAVLSPAAWASGKTSTTPEKLTVRLQQLDLSLFSSLLRMMKADVWIASGVAEGELSLVVAGLDQVKLSGGMLVNQFSLAGEKMQPTVKAELALMADLDYSDREVTIKTLDFASPWLRTRAKGALKLGSKETQTVGSITASCESDLKTVVRDFGPLLGITPELTLQSGQLIVQTTVESDAQGTAIAADMTVENLLMKLGGEPILLKPAPSLTIKARVPQGSRLPEIGELRLRTSFADISARGKLESAKAEGTLNLTAFSRDFRRIFKTLPPMVGNVAFELETEQAESRIRFSSDVTITDLAAEFKPGERTVIPKGTMKTSAFIVPEEGQMAVEDLVLALTIPGGQLSGKCKRFALNKAGEPGKEATRPVVRGLALSTEFEIPALRQLAGPFLSPDLRRKTAGAIGQIVMNATADIAKGETKVLMNAAGQRIAMTHSNVVMKIPDIRMNGSVTQTKPTAAIHVTGDLLSSFAFLREKETLFAEKDAKIVLDMSVSPDFTRAEIKSLDVVSELFGFKGKVELSELTSRMVVSAEGQSTVDCECLTLLLDAQGIDEWTLKGRAARPFKFKAPLAGGINTLFSEGEMACAVAITSAQGMGLEAGSSDASVKLADGRMKISYSPVLNQGKLKLNPTLTMDRNNLMCTVPPKTRVLENVKLNQEMLDGLFTKLFPLFKGSIAQNGAVTLDVNTFSFTSGLPIEQGFSADLLLQLNDIKVVFGPTLREFLARMGSKTSLWEQEQVTMHAQIKGGRIMLDPVTLVVDRHPITISGWVDSTGKINYLLEIKLTERMIGNKIGGSAVGKVIKIPVTGTINEPTIEPNAMLQGLAPVAVEVLREELKDNAKDFLDNIRKELRKKKKD